MDYSTISEAGDHDPNEDFVACITRDGTLCVSVADGLGGHGHGDVASKTVADAVLKKFEEHPGVNRRVLTECFSSAHDILNQIRSGEHRYRDIKTTLSVLITDGKHYVGGYVGDTRIYVFDTDGVFYQTEDHSVPQVLVKAGELDPQNIRYHEDRNKLLRVMGQTEKPKVDIVKKTRISSRIRGILICSDGFWEHIEEKQMFSLLKSAKDSADWIRSMKEVILENGQVRSKGAMDNYSAWAVIFRRFIWLE